LSNRHHSVKIKSKDRIKVEDFKIFWRFFIYILASNHSTLLSEPNNAFRHLGYAYTFVCARRHSWVFLKNSLTILTTNPMF
jgi:hypothetical protein